MEHTIDAAGKTPGRVATAVASLLNGKMSAGFQKHTKEPIKVTVINAAKLSITQKRAKTTTFVRYSGYPGGQTVSSMTKVIASKGHAELIRHAVRGMLPATKLRPTLMKRLTIKA